MNLKINFVLILYLLSIPFAFAGCQQNQSGNETSQMVNDEKKVTIPIEGMSCMSCVATVKKTLSGMDGVKEVNVSLKDKNATVKFDPKKVTPEQLQEAINKLGYKAVKSQELNE
jgi:copper ion binding protein